MADIVFVGQFIASKTGKTGLSPTVDVDRYTISDGTRTALVTAGSTIEGRRGLYHYRLASADLSLYQYVATFITADATVDQQEIAALGLVVPDALTSSRLAPATAGRTLDVDANGVSAVNVTLWKGDAPADLDASGNVYAVTGATGTYSYSNTVDDGSGNLLDGVYIILATDAGFTNLIYSTYTSASGAFTVYSDTAGTHYLRLDLAGYRFADQTVTLA